MTQNRSNTGVNGPFSTRVASALSHVYYNCRLNGREERKEKGREKREEEMEQMVGKAKGKR